MRYYCCYCIERWAPNAKFNVMLQWKDNKKWKTFECSSLTMHFFCFRFLFSSALFVFHYDFDECARHSTALSELGLFVTLQKQLLFRHFLLQWLLLVDEINCKTFFLPFSAYIRVVRGWNRKIKPKDCWIKGSHWQIGFLFRSFFLFFFSFCAYHVSCQRFNCINCDSL